MKLLFIGDTTMPADEIALTLIIIFLLSLLKYFYN